MPLRAMPSFGKEDDWFWGGATTESMMKFTINLTKGPIEDFGIGHKICIISSTISIGEDGWE